jgi:hypothetical protein
MHKLARREGFVVGVAALALGVATMAKKKPGKDQRRGPPLFASWGWQNGRGESRLSGVIRRRPLKRCGPNEVLSESAALCCIFAQRGWGLRAW